MPVKYTESQEHIADFLKQNSVAVISTVSGNNRPNSAAIYYTVDEEFNFYFITKRDTKKSQNLSSNPASSLVVFDASSQTTVQAEGQVSEEKDTNKTQDLFREVLKLSSETSEAGLPPISKLQAGHYVAYKFKPTSLKMASYIRPDGGYYEDVFETI